MQYKKKKRKKNTQKRENGWRWLDVACIGFWRGVWEEEEVVEMIRILFDSCPLMVLRIFVEPTSLLVPLRFRSGTKPGSFFGGGTTLMVCENFSS